MSVTRGSPEDVYGGSAPLDPRDMAKAVLPESQFPVMFATSPVTTSVTGPSLPDKPFRGCQAEAGSRSSTQLSLPVVGDGQ
jgi:hypothetical protein